jgi:hypothetical protein
MAWGEWFQTVATLLEAALTLREAWQERGGPLETARMRRAVHQHGQELRGWRRALAVAMIVLGLALMAGGVVMGLRRGGG